MWMHTNLLLVAQRSPHSISSFYVRRQPYLEALTFQIMRAQFVGTATKFVFHTPLIPYSYLLFVLLNSLMFNLFAK